jgi:Anti-sigma-K factor rskA
VSDARDPTDVGELGDYVFDEADERQRAAFEHRLHEEPELRDRVAQLKDVADTLDHMSAAAWREALSQGDPEAAGPQSAAPRRRPWILTMPGLGVAGLAALILFVAGFGVGAVVSGGGPASTGGARLALRPVAGGPSDVSGNAYLSGETRMVLVIHRLPATQPGHYYEAWLMTNIHQLVPIASFRVNRHGGARLVLQLPADATSYRYVDISLQSVAGGEAHSRVSVLRAPTA